MKLNKIELAVISFLLALSCFVQIPRTEGKFVAQPNSGTVWQSIFTVMDLSEIFYIKGPGTSKNLHGFDADADGDGLIDNPADVTVKDKDGNDVSAEDMYDLTKTVSVSFPAHNASDKPMLICFNVKICVNNSISSAVSDYTIEVTSTKNENTSSLNGQNSNDATFRIPFNATTASTSNGLTIIPHGVQYVEERETPIVDIVGDDYKLFEIYIDSSYYIDQYGTTAYFVLQPGESATYNLNIGGGWQGVDQCKIYSSINLVAVEYTE